jgi:cytochrome c oxidase subunit 1
MRLIKVQKFHPRQVWGLLLLLYTDITEEINIITKSMSNDFIKKLRTILVCSLFGITMFLSLTWMHHMFVVGLNPFLGYLFVLLIIVIVIPSTIRVFSWLRTHWLGNIQFTPAILFAIGFVSMFISGGLIGIFLRNSTLDIHLHDTMFIVAHYQIVMAASAFLGMFCGVYHWFPKMFGRYMNNTMAYIHFWVTFTGAYLIFWPIRYEGLAGMPRRYMDYSGSASFNQFGEANRFISVVVMVVLVAQFMFVFNFFYSIFMGRKMTV